MARVELRIDDFEDGVLPRVCVSTGAPADQLYRLEAMYKPSWPLAFILLGPVGWLVMIVAAAGNARRVGGLLPFSDAALEQLHWTRRVHWRHAFEAAGATATAVGALTLSHDGPSAIVVLLVGIAVTGAYWIAGVKPPRSVGVKLARNGRSVDLVNASDAFVERYRQQEATRLAERQNGPRSTAL